MKWKEKEIKDLTNQELIDASFELNKIQNNYKTKISHPKFEEKFKNQPIPEPNPAFIQLQTEINEELEKRNLP